MAFVPPPNDAGVRAPAIPANPPSLLDITNTKEYVDRLTKFKDTQAEIHATDDEIGAAQLFHHECVLRASLGGEAAPPWLAAFADTLNQIRQTVERIERNQQATNAAIANMRIAKSNIELARNTGITAYRAKQKEVVGDGSILANAAAPNNNHPLLPYVPAPPAVGAAFSPTIETHNLNHITILRIIQFYNQSFDILPADTVPIRAQKIVNWLTAEI